MKTPNSVSSEPGAGHTPEFVSQQPLILGNEHSALRRDVTDWLASDGRSAQALMAFDNVEAIKSLVAVGLGASIVPSLALGEGHVSASKIIAVPLKPHAGRRVGLVRIRNKPITIAMGAVIEALLTLRQNA